MQSFQKNRINTWLVKVAIMLLLISYWSIKLEAQTSILTINEAIAKGLENNFSVKLAKNDYAIAQNNNSIGNAGFLPTIGATGSIKDNNAAITTKNSYSEVSKINNANTETLALGATLDWTIFDGFAMFIKKDRLETLSKMGKTAFRSSIENVVSEIIVSYYAIVQYQNRLAMLQNAINFSNSRLELTKKKVEIGLQAELAYLQATTDLNADSTAYLRQKIVLENAKANLNNLLVENPNHQFKVENHITFNNLISYESVKFAIPKYNTQAELARQQAEIADLDYRLAHSPKYPKVAFFSSYNFSNSTYNFGQSLENRNLGPTFGINVAVPIFDGFNKQRISANAKIATESSHLELEQTIRKLDLTLYQLYNNYTNNLKLVAFESENLKVSEKNSKIAFEKFRVGELSDFELRQTQLSLLAAENSLFEAQFQAKKSETELLRLCGKLGEK